MMLLGRLAAPLRTSPQSTFVCVISPPDVDRERLAGAVAGRVVGITVVVGLVGHVGHGREGGRLGRPVCCQRDGLVDRGTAAGEPDVAVEDDVAGRIRHQRRCTGRPGHEHLVVHDRAGRSRRDHGVGRVVDVGPGRVVGPQLRRRAGVGTDAVRVAMQRDATDAHRGVGADDGRARHRRAERDRAAPGPTTLSCTGSRS